jgi:phosphatidate phosphatase APP1
VIVRVTVKLSDGGSLTLSTDEEGYILGRTIRRKGHRDAVHTIRLTDEAITQLPALVQSIGRLF